jgi:hypothetical protein
MSNRVSNVNHNDNKAWLRLTFFDINLMSKLPCSQLYVVTSTLKVCVLQILRLETLFEQKINV